ncbi:hypothetical protein CL614_06900 [archaeon]|nr:hypothetical protein [archaeon]|tara:strand:+ start:561 stop:845 length:285 start_codon:yes stop_codon:yes gene_type:complete
MKSFNVRIEAPEILLAGAVVLNLYEKTTFSYVVFCVGLVFALVRAAYGLHLNEEEKKRKEKNIKEVRAFLLKSARAVSGQSSSSSSSSSGQLPH